MGFRPIPDIIHCIPWFSCGIVAVLHVCTVHIRLVMDIQTGCVHTCYLLHFISPGVDLMVSLLQSGIIVVALLIVVNGAMDGAVQDSAYIPNGVPFLLGDLLYPYFLFLVEPCCVHCHSFLWLVVSALLG